MIKISIFPKRGELTSILCSFHREFVIVGLFSMVANILLLTPTLYMLQVYDRVIASQSGLTLLAVSAISLFLFAVMAFSEWARSRLLVRTGVKLDEELNSRVFTASFEAALNQSGKNPLQAFTDLINVRQFLTGNGIFAFFDAPWTPIYLFVLFLLHPLLGKIALVFSMVLASLTYLGHHLTKKSTAALLQTTTELNSYVHSKLRNAEVIEALGMLDHLRRRWVNRQRRHLQAASTSQDINQRLQVISKFIRYSQQSLMLGAGAWLVTQGELTTGGMIAANVLMLRALAPIDLITASWKSFITARTAIESLNALFYSNPVRDARVVHPEPIGQMQIEGLVATAPGREKPILGGLNADFPAGEIIAIIGPSGSGKSTLARALVGVWPQRQGLVLLDGEPIENWERNELGPHIGYLPQDIELLEGSIAENIARFGEVDPEKVIDAAQRTGIHDMILRFPKGYDTPMGEAGNMLSGGQRQRIGLARALYGNPAIIVLDEPNANLDDAGETALIEALRYLKGMRKTVFMITHRMNIIGAVDRILLLIDGQIRRYGLRAEVIEALKNRL
ncbi:Alkaline protease secretion ATP-binding protein AprD [Gammaproteobacteria bacterium]